MLGALGAFSTMIHFWTPHEKRLMFVAGILLVLLAIHLLVPDVHRVLYAIHATMPFWTALGWIGLAATFVSRAHRYALYAYGLVALYHVYAFWLPLWDGHTDPGVRSARIVTANLFVGNRIPDPLVRELGAVEADVMVLLEVDDRWRQHLQESAWYDQYPYRLDAERDDAYGMMVLARVPLRNKETLDLDGVPALSAHVRVHDREMRLVGVHLSPPLSEENIQRQARQIQILREWIERPGLPPVLLTGDLNLTPWNPGFATLARAPLAPIPPRLGRAYWPTWRPIALIPELDLHIAPIDHTLVEDMVRVHRFVLGAGNGSDHRPQILDVSW